MVLRNLIAAAYDREHGADKTPPAVPKAAVKVSS